MEIAASEQAVSKTAKSSFDNMMKMASCFVGRRPDPIPYEKKEEKKS